MARRHENEGLSDRALEGGSGSVRELPRRDSRDANGEGLLIPAYLMRADKDPSERPEVRNGHLTSDLVVGEADEDFVASRTETQVAAPDGPLLIRLARGGLGVAPASRRAPERNDLAETRSFSDGACAAEDDLVVRTDPGIVGLRPVGSSVEREVDAGRRDCHRPTVTADCGASCHPTGLRAVLIPVRTMVSMIGTKEVALAREHPRGTERRRLLPYRDALNDLEAYAALSEPDRDAIVRWAETRRRIKEAYGIDHDPANLADPLLPEERLRAHVLAGERAAARRSDFVDPGGDLIAAVAALRRA